MYNLKETMLAKCYIEVLGLDKHSDAAQRLIRWKQPVEGQVCRKVLLGDIDSRRRVIRVILLVYATMR